MVKKLIFSELVYTNSSVFFHVKAIIWSVVCTFQSQIGMLASIRASAVQKQLQLQQQWTLENVFSKNVYQ